MFGERSHLVLEVGEETEREEDLNAEEPTSG